jgi:hypothetical protein
VFYKGKTILGTTPLINGNASYTTADLQAGTRSITAVYKGSSLFGTSTSPAVSQVVNPPCVPKWKIGQALVEALEAAVKGDDFIVLE